MAVVLFCLPRKQLQRPTLKVDHLERNEVLKNFRGFLVRGPASAPVSGGMWGRFRCSRWRTARDRSEDRAVIVAGYFEYTRAGLELRSIVCRAGARDDRRYPLRL
jgi:hypothetical protein